LLGIASSPPQTAQKEGRHRKPTSVNTGDEDVRLVRMRGHSELEVLFDGGILLLGPIGTLGEPASSSQGSPSEGRDRSCSERYPKSCSNQSAG
jgi:hypothetical protein